MVQKRGFPPLGVRLASLNVKDHPMMKSTEYQAYEFKFFASVNPRFEGGILDFTGRIPDLMGRIPDLMENFNIF